MMYAPVLHKAVSFLGSPMLTFFLFGGSVMVAFGLWADLGIAFWNGLATLVIWPFARYFTDE